VLTFNCRCVKINEIKIYKGYDKKEYILSGITERRWQVKIFMKVIWKQSWSYEPKGVILVGFIGVSAVKRKAVSIIFCTG